MRKPMRAVRPLSAACLLLVLPGGSWAAAPTVRLWDTVAPLRQPTAGAADRARWRAVTAAEAGRLRGDLVVETAAMGAAFASRLGKALVYGLSEPRVPPCVVRPAEPLGPRPTLVSTVAERDGAVAVTVEFRGAGGRKLPIAFTFTGDGSLGIAPQGRTRAIALMAPIAVAVVPSFVGEDLLFVARDYSRIGVVTASGTEDALFDDAGRHAASRLSVPSEHWLLGLLEGGNAMLVMTWQDEVPSVRLSVRNSGGRGAQGATTFGAVSFVGGSRVSLAILSAPGIWHRENLNPGRYLERDVPIPWRPPFPARWLTQLYEDGVPTTFEFRDRKETTWRGGVGSYTYPVWFSAGRAMFSLGKKIPPEGQAIIYFLEGTEKTPRNVVSPTEIIQQTLAGDVLAHLLDAEGRPAWYPHREDSVLGGATCGVTDRMKEIFDAGREVEQQELIAGGVEDMYAYLEGMFERNARFYPFAQEMMAYLDAQAKANPKLKPLLGELRGIAEEIAATYDQARDTIRDMGYARELGAQTIALAAERRPDNPQRFVELKQAWTTMGGALERLACREHTLTRKLYQQAGYGAATRPEAMPVVKEVRRRTRACLRRPESYEIWANY